MADNVAITAGAGTTVAADDIAGVMHQRVKISLGADGAAVDAVGGTGAMSSAVQRVTIATDDPVITAINATNSQLPTSLGEQTRANSLSVVAATSAFSAAVTLTRTADTNVYAANDVLGGATGSTAALTFASMGPSAGRIMITSASLEIDASAIISGETSYLLHLYNVTPPSALGDNAAFDLPSGDRSAYLGFVNLGTPADLGSTLYVQTDGINKQILLSGTSLFGYLVTVGTYTPTSARVHVVTLHAVSL